MPVHRNKRKLSLTAHHSALSTILLLLALCHVTFADFATTQTPEAVVDGFFTSSGHTNNWAVLVCTSRFWFNYRHMANALSLYRTVKRLGIPDSQIIMMLADDAACNTRNAAPGNVFNNKQKTLDLYGENVEVDYRGNEVSVENFIRVLTGRVTPDTPRSKRLLTDDRSNIFVYMTGHGGDEFLKFQDAEEISAFDLADAFGQMWEKKRYHEILFMIDTCQANTMYGQIYSPNIIATGSAKLGENSLSYHNNDEIGVAVIDRFTHFNLEFLERVDMQSRATLANLFNSYNDNIKEIRSTPGVRTDLFRRPIDKVLVTDFFGSVRNVEVTSGRYNLSGASEIFKDADLQNARGKPSMALVEEPTSSPVTDALTSRNRHKVQTQSLKSSKTSSDKAETDSIFSMLVGYLKQLSSYTHIFPFSSHSERQHSLYKLHSVVRGEDMRVY